ncbi:hypothetical protein Ahy_A04g019863 [Arachis hypogaea]|uniref:Uncharacterized protein n=1 Tax=Arachis hypogaea TaxID=3818 RepID=A0A445DGQ3_ARAHY|nr:hypothetical protein Ahy_A04g019863 [Arachis hypogaea]
MGQEEEEEPKDKAVGLVEQRIEAQPLELQLSSYTFWSLTTHKTFKVQGEKMGQKCCGSILLVPVLTTGIRAPVLGVLCMVSTRAAMESRLEAVEKRIEELQEAQQRPLEAFSANMLRQIRELLPQQHQGGGADANDTGGRNNGGRNEQDDERVEGNGGAASSSGTRGSGTRRLSDEEWAERQRKGLCFRCGEKWGPTHVCPMKHYKILLIEEEEENHEAELEDERSELPVEEPKGVELQLSSYSFWGLTTQNLQGERGDFGLGSDGAHRPWSVGKLHSHREVVLGAGWLANLEKFVGDYSELTLNWKQGDKEFHLQGDPSLSRRVSTNSIATKVVKRLGLPVLGLKKFRVEVGNSAFESENGGVKGGELKIEGVTHSSLLLLDGAGQH